MTDVERDEPPSFSVAQLSADERLVWLLGDLMDAAENYFGRENPKRLGHITSSAIRIIDEVITPLRASLSQAEAEGDTARAELRSVRSELGERRRNVEWLQALADENEQRADALAAENARLREALKEIANDDFQHYANDRMIVGITRNRASAALKGAGTP